MLNSITSFCTYTSPRMSNWRPLFPNTEDRGSSHSFSSLHFLLSSPNTTSVGWIGFLGGLGQAIQILASLDLLEVEASFFFPSLHNFVIMALRLWAFYLHRCLRCHRVLSPYFSCGPLLFFSQLWKFRFIRLSNRLLRTDLFVPINFVWSVKSPFFFSSPEFAFFLTIVLAVANPIRNCHGRRPLFHCGSNNHLFLLRCFTLALAFTFFRNILWPQKTTSIHLGDRKSVV